MRIVWIVAALAAVVGVGAVGSKTLFKSTKLHTGWSISPVGKTQEIPDFPVGLALSPNGKWIGIVCAGQGIHKVMTVAADSGKVVSTVDVTRAWNGVAWSPDGKRLYASGGTSPNLYTFNVGEDGVLDRQPNLKFPQLSVGKNGDTPAAWLAGMAVSKDGSTIYMANASTDQIFAINPESKEVKEFAKFETNDSPYAVSLTRDGKSLVTTLQGGGELVKIDLATGDKESVTVGRHPNAISFVKNSVFVSCGNEDYVAEVNATTWKVARKISIKTHSSDPAGQTPSALAATADGKTLFVADSDTNSVAVVDILSGNVKGYIPTGWYAVSLMVSGNSLFVGSAKGVGRLGPNNDTQGKFDTEAPKGYPYIVALFKGALQMVPIPNEKTLAAYTEQVKANTPYRVGMELQPANAPKPGTNPIPSKVGDPSSIKHILYIIKENRTYDQVLGDLTDKNGKPMGNGDKSLTIFGEDVTPNHHQIARDFVLFDNLYCSGEVSVDGHHWSNGAYVPDYMQRTWPQQYSGKGTPRLPANLADTPAGRIWDRCEQAGVTYRTYYYHTKQNANEDWAKARSSGRRDYDYVQVFIDEFKEFEKTGKMPQFMVMALSEDHTSGTTPGRFTPKAAVGSNDLGVGKILEAISHSSYWSKFAVFVIEDDAQNGPDHVDAHRTVSLVASPYIKRGTIDSTEYNTCSLLRTMELILGLKPMTLFDAAATPMYKAFQMKPDLTPYTALQPKIDLEARNKATDYGAAESKRFNFNEPDLYGEEGEEALNRILWHSIKGRDVKYPGSIHTKHAAQPDKD